MTELTIPEGISIETLDGETITLQPGASVLDYLPGGGGEPLYRLAVTQSHRDPRLPDHPDFLFLMRRIKRVNEAGENFKETETIPLGKEIRAYPVGLAANRSYFASSYDPDNPTEPDCRSENYITPDAAYAGKFSTVCARLSPRTGKLVAACPMAQWGPKQPNNKSTPPPCGESYVIFMALSVTREEGSAPELMVVESYFKSSSAVAGKSVVQQLRAQIARGLPIWNFPLDITVKPVGQGNTYIPVLRADVKQEFSEEDKAGLQDAIARAEEAIRYRLQRAATPPENPPTPAPQVDLGATVPEGGRRTIVPPEGGNGKGKGKKQVDPLV